MAKKKAKKGVSPKAEITSTGVTVRYAWGHIKPCKMDARVVSQELEALREANGGHLTAQMVVDAAKPKRSRLHSCFDWDDMTAGAKWRLEQARHLIRAVVIYYDDDDEASSRAYYSIPTGKGGKPAYQHIRAILQDPENLNYLIERAEEDILAWRARYRHLKKFVRVVAAIDSLNLLKP